MKTFDTKSNSIPETSEPVTAYARLDSVSHKPIGKQEIPPDCMTVDEYFDELLALIHQDYARLRGEN